MTWQTKVSGNGEQKLQKPHIRVLIVSGIIIWVEDDLQGRGAPGPEWLLSLFAYWPTLLEDYLFINHYLELPWDGITEVDKQ